MADIMDNLRTLTADPTSFAISALVFLTVFAALSAAGLNFLSSKPKRTDPASKAPGGPSSGQPVPDPAGAAMPGQPFARRAATPELGTSVNRGMATPSHGLRRIMKRIHRGLALLMMAVLVTLTVGAYLATDPDDGSRLAFWVLATATLLAGLHLLNADDRIGDPAEDGTLRADFMRKVESDIAAKLGGALLGQSPVRWEIASPEVHCIDHETLALAQEMAARGNSVHEICRTIDSGYDRWTATHQHAYRNVIRSALEYRAPPTR